MGKIQTTSLDRLLAHYDMADFDWWPSKKTWSQPAVGIDGRPEREPPHPLSDAIAEEVLPSLPDWARDVIEALYWERVTFREYARRTGRHPEQIRRDLDKALELFAKKLNECAEAEGLEPPKVPGAQAEQP